MNAWKLGKLEQLEAKIEQHELLITQLVEVIAATNKRLVNLSEDQGEIKRVYTHV